MMIRQATKFLSGSFVIRTETSFSSYFIQHLPSRIQTRGKKTCTEEENLKKKTSTKKRCEEKPKNSRKLVTAATVVVVGTTLTVIAAKNDDDFREWAKEHVPTLDKLVKIAYQEEESYLESLLRAHKELTEWIKKTLYDTFKGMKQVGGPDKGSASSKEPCEDPKKPYKPPQSAFIVKPDEDKKDAKEDSAASKKSALPTRYKDLKMIEDILGQKVQDTIQSYHASICALKDQANIIDNLDQLISNSDPKVWTTLQKKMQDGQKHLEKAEASFKKATEVAEIFLCILDCNQESRLDTDEDWVVDLRKRARNNLAILTGDVKKAKENFEKEKEKMLLAKRSWDKVRKARMYFSDELETLFPNVWLNDEKLNLPMDSLEPFIENKLKSIMYLEKELAKAQTVLDPEVTSAIDNFKLTGNSDDLIKAAIKLETSKEKRLRQEEMQKILLTHKAKCDKIARSQMKQQAEVYSDLKAEALRMMEREVERKMQQQLEERLAEVRAQHKMEIAKMVGRIQGANEAIAQRGDKDKYQQKKQQFWSAAQSFMAAVKPIGKGLVAKPNELKPLKNEITNVLKAAPDDDEVVKDILSSIPDKAVERGVQSETVLRERFLTVEQEARKVAAVPLGTVTLVQLFLARLQNGLYVNESIPQAELDNEPIDVEELNNYEIIFRARYFVDRGEFDQAVRYLHLLKGPAKTVASDWIKDVIVYLETRQAAEFLLAYASAPSLQANNTSTD